MGWHPSDSSGYQRFRLTDSEFCWRGHQVHKSGCYQPTDHGVYRYRSERQVERCSRVKTVGDRSSGQPAQQQFPVRERDGGPWHESLSI